jgi:hypothetical protein
MFGAFHRILLTAGIVLVSQQAFTENRIARSY